jgi:hypothetical protein
MRPDLHGKRARVLGLLKGPGLTVPQLNARLRGDMSGTVKRLAAEGKVEAVENPDGLDRARIWRAVEMR